VKTRVGSRLRGDLLLLFSLGFSLLISPASAYIDPGTASVVWQFMLAVVLGAAFTVRLYWTRIKDYFRKKPDKSTKV